MGFCVKIPQVAGVGSYLPARRGVKSLRAHLELDHEDRRGVQKDYVRSASTARYLVFQNNVPMVELPECELLLEQPYLQLPCLNLCSPLTSNSCRSYCVGQLTYQSVFSSTDELSDR